MTPAQAKRRCDRLFSEQVRARGVCEAKGQGLGRACSTQLQCAHLISRRYAWTRCDPRNAFCLCATHHRWFTDFPWDFYLFAVAKIGQTTYDELHDLADRRDTFDWHAKLAELELATRVAP